MCSGLSYALHDLQNNLRSGVQPVVVFVSDGYFSPGAVSPVGVADQIRADENGVVLSVGIAGITGRSSLFNRAMMASVAGCMGTAVCDTLFDASLTGPANLDIVQGVVDKLPVSGTS